MASVNNISKDRKGLFITLEGGEGVGKSTQSRLLAETLEKSGFKVYLTREPGGTKGAEQLRELLLFGGANFSCYSEILLHMAARLDHVEKMIRPALAEGKIVICDRYHDSTLAYQGFGIKGGDKDALALIETLRCFINCEADATFWLDMALEKTQQRLSKRGNPKDHYERQEVSFHERVKQGFERIYQAEPKRIIPIDASPCEEDVQEQIYHHVKALLVRKKM
ncbi:dTMP kinase [Aristophania vespae]|uniref:dTMP kinase n=1 Tax=Aristophania vespae TaxID=2697033 RepID=UPI00235199CC|nr:dTMP kinase [Aristophania vespae]UMM63342.1 Thymidylate kinase [Aristophania vespae]